MAKLRLIDKIKNSLESQGLPARTNLARNWLKAKVKDIQMPNSSKSGFVNNSKKSRQVGTFGNNFIGRMYFYFYNPKTKDKLEYYDIFPLVIPIEMHNDGFLGLNLHYIPPKDRVILLDKLSTVLNNDSYDATTKFRLSYDYISKARRLFEAKPCLKKYLFTHVQSKMLEITADEWDIAVFLPFESFMKESKSKVWSDSRKKY